MIALLRRQWELVRCSNLACATEHVRETGTRQHALPCSQCHCEMIVLPLAVTSGDADPEPFDLDALRLLLRTTITEEQRLQQNLGGAGNVRELVRLQHRADAFEEALAMLEAIAGSADRDGQPAATSAPPDAPRSSRAADRPDQLLPSGACLAVDLHEWGPGVEPGEEDPIGVECELAVHTAEGAIAIDIIGGRDGGRRVLANTEALRFAMAGGGVEWAQRPEVLPASTTTQPGG